LTFVIFFWNVLPARRYAIAGLCDNNVFVRPFVTSWYCVKVSWLLHPLIAPRF